MKKSSFQQPVIGITIGDPAGIGPEIIEKAVVFFAKQSRGPKLHAIGSAKGCKAGALSKTSAQRALDALEISVDLLKKGKINAVVNAPIHKANISQIGFPFPGQTEFYAARCGIPEDKVTMMLTSSKLTVSLVTIHCSLRDAIQKMTPTRIEQTVRHTIEVLMFRGIKTPRLAVCGLNPHAGENGLFGTEEIKVIAPTIARLQKKYSQATIDGPFSPDTIFLRATKGEFDAVICMYHDQGLIPLKLIAFDSGVNVTLGLPFGRTSPDHGTAVNIAGKGIASAASLISAIRLAAKLSSVALKQKTNNEKRV